MTDIYKHDLRKKFLKQAAEEWEKIGICNDFIFCKVMQDKKLLSELIRIILPDLRFKELSIDAQKSIEIGPDIHGVRFDILVTLDDGEFVEIEMQVINNESLPRRMRYYEAMADMQNLERGITYDKLNNIYVIMISPFDQFKKGRHVYTFTNRCREDNSIEMGDGSTKIFLNASGIMSDVSGRLKEFLDYVAGKPSNDEFVKSIDEAVVKARRNRKWRAQYMTLWMRDLEKIEEGKIEGIKEGREEAHREKIASMLLKGKSPEDIADFCDYPLELVLEVQKSLTVPV